MGNTATQNRNDSFFSCSKKEFENCLLPIWIYGSSTMQELSTTLKVPINEITGRFNSSKKKGLIAENEATPSKFNKRTRKQNTLYILTAKGKEIVSEKMKFQNNQKEAV